MVKFGSVCSGIESASVAFEPLGMSAAWFSEIEPFPCALLKARFPTVVNYGDMVKLPEIMRAGLIEAPDILIGGTPCQAFSVAGKRKGLDDERGQLSLAYVDLLNAIDEQRSENGKKEAVSIWENVPGVLSDTENAFGCFLAELAGDDQPIKPPENLKKYNRKHKSGRNVPKWSKCGVVYGPRRTIAWRVLNAQYFGVAQRRARVFVVASARNDIDLTEVLFEREGVRRDIAPSRETKKGFAGYTASSFSKSVNRQLVGSLCASDRKGVSNQLVGDGKVVYPIHDKATRHAGATGKGSANGFGVGSENDPSPTLTTGDKHSVNYTDIVRRLTPTECERLQGFPDGWTKIKYRNKDIDECPEGPRYKAIGNSKAVPVVRWLGERLQKEILKNEN